MNKSQQIGEMYLEHAKGGKEFMYKGESTELGPDLHSTLDDWKLVDIEPETIDLSSFVGSEIDMVFDESHIGKLYRFSPNLGFYDNENILWTGSCRPRFGEWNVITDCKHKPPKGSRYQLRYWQSKFDGTQIELIDSEVLEGGLYPDFSGVVAIRYHKEAQPGYKWG